MQDLIGRGLPLRIYALRPPRTCRVHADAAALRDRVTYRPRPGSLADLRAHLRVLYHQPGRYLALLSGVLLESRGCPARLRQKLVALDAAICMASPMRDRGTGHLHAHFAGVPTTAARYASRLLGIPFSFTAHARDIYVEGRQDRPGLAASLKQAAFAVTCTEYNREYLTQRFPQVPAGKIHRVYHGIDPDRFAVRRERDAGPMRILAVGRLQRKKGLHVLFEACGILHGLGREFTVIIAGDGPEKERLTRLAQERGIQGRVLFLGEVTQEEILPAYASADVLALPCLVERSGDRDGLPNVILEALAAGLAVVTTPVSGIPEVIEEGVTGLLVPSEDPAALAAALERLMDDPDLARRLGEAGRERVRRDFDLRNSPLADLFAAEAGIAAAAPAAAAGARNGRSRHSPVAHS